jgi:hypothetical protein
MVRNNIRQQEMQIGGELFVSRIFVYEKDDVDMQYIVSFFGTL